jgi:exonuclease SbcC
MRPLTLTIEGLRSFRAPVKISFEGRDHLAIIGDTGAGKSSILEAMTYALFGRTTFTGHANQEIMNDLADHMRVTLRFAVAGRTFEVTRTLRRASDRTVGAARASLTEFGPDGTEIHKIEQVRLVGGRIQEVLGLDAEAFIRTVVLPQGQFAKLLVGDDPSARAAILRQVWRADELTKAGQLADEALPPLSQLVGQVTQALDGTPEKPQAYLQLLQADAELRAGIAKRARATHRAAIGARDALAQAGERIESAENVLGKIGGFDFGAATAAAEEVVRSASAIATERATVETEQEKLRGQLRVIPSDDDGLDHQAIGAARITLDQLPSRAEAAASAARRARTDAAGAEDAERRVADLEQEVQGLNPRIDRLEGARQDLDATLASAETMLTGAQALLRDAQHAAAEASSLQAQASGKGHQVELLRQEMTTLRERDLGQAEQYATAADMAYADAQRHNSAAAAAHGLHPGDDCSVCNRPLPPAWQAPVAESLDSARDAHTAAQAILSEMRNSIRDLATREEILNTQAVELQEGAERSWETARTAATQLASLLGTGEIDLAILPSAEEILQPLSDAVARAREELASHVEESQQLRQQHTIAETNLTNAHDSLEKIRAAHALNSKQAAAAAGALRTALTSLPDQLKIDVALPDDPVGIEAIPLGGLDAAYQVLDDRAQELNHRAERRRELQQQLDDFAAGIRNLNMRWADQVHAPGNELIATVNTHRDALTDSIALLNIRDVTMQPAASLSNPAALAEIVLALRVTTDVVIQRTRALAEEAHKDADMARQGIATLATELAVVATDAQPVDPDQVVACASDKATEADVEARAAERAAENFSRLVAPLIQLRRAGEELSLAHRVLRDLSAALKPGAFPKWLTLRRSRALLIHASRLLEQMSGGRYAFAELDDENDEWRVIDNDSGLARTPASLSGGEQFIASLALALGMVEMMARSGGRLESLWLDEGFGSLDRSNLDAAIEALASVAARGRMVAVISHIRAVADQVNHVLAVTREATGTQASWLNPHQRAQMATGDLESETASALSGLLD